MRLFKVFLSVLSIGLLVFMLGCNAANTAQRRLEDEGYVVVPGNEEDVSEELSEYGIEDIENIYIIYDDEDDNIPNGIIVEYSSQAALEEDILAEGETINDYSDYIYRNLFIISLEVTNLDQIIDIVKGES